jgi:hypothetical protein
MQRRQVLLGRGGAVFQAVVCAEYATLWCKMKRSRKQKMAVVSVTTAVLLMSALLGMMKLRNASERKRSSKCIDSDSDSDVEAAHHRSQQRRQRSNRAAVRATRSEHDPVRAAEVQASNTAARQNIRSHMTAGETAAEGERNATQHQAARAAPGAAAAAEVQAKKTAAHHARRHPLDYTNTSEPYEAMMSQLQSFVFVKKAASSGLERMMIQLLQPRSLGHAPPAAASNPKSSVLHVVVSSVRAT